MAVEIGTATDHTDLYTKLYSFLTTNSELVAAGQNWERVWGAEPPFTAVNTLNPDYSDSDVVLRGPGLSGDDSVYVGMSLRNDPTADVFGIWFSGAQGVGGGAQQYNQHLNSALGMHVPLFNNSMPYWFVANGRRFIVVARVSTTFVACYQGLILPYATPTEYPYPLISSGCAATTLRWSDEQAHHTHFCMPWESWNSSNPPITGVPVANDGRVRLLLPSGAWLPFSNRRWEYSTFPWENGGVGGNQERFLHGQRSLFGGGQMLQPVTLLARGTSLQGLIGVFDGVYHVSGFGSAAENIIQADGYDHLVVQNMFRTGFSDYWALRLE